MQGSKGGYLAALSIMTLAAPARAESATDPQTQAANADEGGSTGDIIVTAQRREERLSDVPMAITALSAEDLRAGGITKLQDLTRVVPSMQFSRHVGRADAVSFGIRGQRTSDVRMHIDQAVTAYLAEVPMKLPYGLGITGFLDLRSVEVLRGPQGTLFGRNSTGGAILLVPNTPTDRREAFVEITAGNYRKLSAQAWVNLPLGEGVGLRIAGTTGRRDGFVKSRSFLPDFNSDDFYGGRVTFQLEKGNITTTFYGDALSYDSSGQSGMLRAVNPAGSANRYPIGIGGGAVAALAERDASPFYSSRSADPTYIHTRIYGLSNTTVWTMSDTLLLKNVAGYRHVQADAATNTGDSPFTWNYTRQFTRQRQWSEELQLQYNGDNLHFIVGGFFFDEKGVDNPAIVTLTGFALQVQNLNDIHNQSVSMFSEGTLDLSNRLHLTVGGRYTWDYRRMQTQVFEDNRQIISPPPAVPGITCGIRDASGVVLPLASCTRTVSARFRKPTFNVTAKYDLADDQQAYASFRRGYRSGGFNLSSRLIEQFEPFRPETVDAYEVGYKGTMPVGAGRLRLGLAGYYSNYSDIQKTVNFCRGTPCGLTARTQNAATAVIKGIEAEAGFRQGPIDLSAHYSYTDAHYKQYVSVASGGVPVDLSATPFGYVPKHKLGGTIAYTINLDHKYDLVVRADSTWQSSQELDDVAGPGTHQRAYNLTNLRAEWTDKDGGLTLALWGTNVFGTRYFVTSNNVYSSIGYTVAYAGEPAMYGVQASVRF